MAAEPVATWTVEQLNADDSVTKKQIVEFLHANASSDFLKKQKLNGKVPNVVKSATRPQLITAYSELFQTKEFRNEEEEAKKAEEAKKEAEVQSSTPANDNSTPTATQTQEPEKVPRYKKSVLKAGDKKNYPKKGDSVSVRYKGTLEDGKVFDQNTEPVKKKLPPPLKFKVGTGKVIRGWDEALLTMSVGEKSKITIEPEWAYGKKGIPDAYPQSFLLDRFFLDYSYRHPSKCYPYFRGGIVGNQLSYFCVLLEANCLITSHYSKRNTFYLFFGIDVARSLFRDGREQHLKTGRNVRFTQHNMKLAARIPIAGKTLPPRFPNYASRTSKSFQQLTPFTHRQYYNWNRNYGRSKFFEPTQLKLKSFDLTKNDGRGIKWLCLGAAMFFASSKDQQENEDEEGIATQRTHGFGEPGTVLGPSTLGLKDLLVHSSMGTLVGFAVGYAARKSLKLLFFLLGGQFIMLQILQHLGYIEIKWGKVTKKVEQKWENERSQIWNTAKAILTENVPFKGGFLAGMAWGFHFPV